MKYVINTSSIQIENPIFKNSKNESILKFSDHGQLSLSVKNNSDVDLTNVKGQVTTTEKENGIIDYDKLYGNFNLGKGSELNLPLNINTDFSVPQKDVHFTITFTYSGITLAEKTLDIPTESFYKTTNVAVPEYTSSRLKAVAGYYGFSNTPFADVSKQLDPLAASGDKMAAMWRAAFLSMGYGEYKIDEDEAYTIGKAAFPTVESKARNGDAEALYLMFYACQMGLEGDAGKTFGNDFLKKSAVAGFLPARYDYALVAAQQKDYSTALNELLQLYDNGVKKAASILSIMYEKGEGANEDANTAMGWCKKGTVFGDPEAMLSMANLYVKGFENAPPDPAKAMVLATEAANKGCVAAMVFIGEKYANGKEGIAVNIPVAIKWLKQGAEKGNRQAMVELGLLYTSDVAGMVKDENTGIFWIKKAAIAGSPTAMKVLFRAYSSGNGIEKNQVIARYWYNQLALIGNAQQDNTAMVATAQSFSDFWNYADFSPSYVLVDHYGDEVGDSGDGLFNGLVSGMFGAMRGYYGNQQQLIDGLEYICKRDGSKVYGGTVSSYFASNLYLKAGQTVGINAYGTVSTGMMSGMATADGLGNSWQEYAIVKGIPCSAVIAAVKGSDWKFIGQRASYTAPKEGPLGLAINAIDYRNYKGYFDVVVRVPDN
ncbi:MAG: sel1 repeat family protein [Bacteroidota bacterium]|nr:sel1 repeat family protein [Bacteroidota bacterium]